LFLLVNLMLKIPVLFSLFFSVISLIRLWLVYYVNRHKYIVSFLNTFDYYSANF
jgi:hypothetical protein